MENILGTLTLIFAISMVIIALPSQIRKNHQEKKCGLSFTMTLLPLCIYISRSGYAFTINSWYILIPDVIGLIFSCIIFIQFFLYKTMKGGNRG